MRKEMDGNVFFPRQSRHFHFDVCVVKVLFRIRTLTWRLKILCFPPRKGTDMREEGT